eukprot:CAMPEP_0171694318 /NCGR_PEP_ID=MMETSP0991-20121206/7151_1 /TAXON_ID=483369 /ORGANISM="non described non described, Strain CCMP2098" /LENGTH=233 /DNA_ID=CAMNT_0012282891 /DNA_START=277 /DNA_END=976 /DNA_ORIENTATION=+
MAQYNVVTAYLHHQSSGIRYAEHTVHFYVRGDSSTELMEGSRLEVGAEDCTEDPSGFYSELRRDLRRQCGDICNTTVPLNTFVGKVVRIWTSKRTFEARRLRVSLGKSAELEGQVGWPPPRLPPCPMIQDFVQHMGTELRDWFIYWERSLEGRANTAGQVWSEELIDGLVHNISNGMSSPNSYGRQAIDDNIEAAEFMGIKGKRVLVVGSEWPWLEASLLVAGADHVVTLEYR